jgi:hypothetical protein
MPRYFKNDAPLASRGEANIYNTLSPTLLLTISSQIHTSNSKPP